MEKIMVKQIQLRYLEIVRSKRGEIDGEKKENKRKQKKGNVVVLLEENSIRRGPVLH